MLSGSSLSRVGLAELLMVASVHHLRTVTEVLPVGEIAVDHTGCIRSVDQFTTALLGGDGKVLLGLHVDKLMENSLSELVASPDSVRAIGIDFSRVAEVAFDLEARMVLVPSLEPHFFRFCIYYTI